MEKEPHPVQPRLDKDVAEVVVAVAAKNERTVPREVNNALRRHYRIQKPKKKMT